MDRGVAPGQLVICPDCRSENIEGADVCEVCGADLSDLKRPRADSQLEEVLTKGTLHDLGSKDALAVGPGDPVALAAHFMREHNLEAVLVRDGEKIVGIVTERDILMKAAGATRDLMAMAVKDIMTPDPVILREEDSLAVAVHKMSVGGFRHMPFVTDDGKTQLISIQDVFTHVSPHIPHQ